jgi:hypothetical protein
VPPRSTYALARANHPGRYIALVIGEDGDATCVVKLATDDSGRAALEREAEALDSIARFLPEPLTAPTMLARADGVLVLEAVRYRPRSQPWLLPDAVARAMARFHASGPSGAGETGLTHGDFAPWNLLETDSGWVLVDWEAAQENAPPFHDLFHFFVQAYSLLKRPRREELLGALSGEGHVGRAIREYAAAGGLDPASARDYLLLYLRTSGHAAEAGLPDREGARIRRHLIEALEGP